MELKTVADELYALLPEEFTATRTAREKEAKAAGDKELAAQIHAMPKPNQVAWLANQLARQHADELRPLVELGAGLRDAADAQTGDQLREFARQKRQLVGALVARARRLASQAGRKVSDDTARGLEETLNAGLADPAAAELLLAGRLSGGLQYSGFGPAVEGGGPPLLSSFPAASTPSAASPRSKTKEQRVAERVVAADQELEAARSAVDRAAQSKTEEEQAVQRAATAHEEAEEEVARLHSELDRATTAQAEADWERRRTKKDLEKAERLGSQAQRRLREAEERRAALDP